MRGNQGAFRALHCNAQAAVSCPARQGGAVVQVSALGAGEGERPVPPPQEDAETCCGRADDGAIVKP